jgi:hypothetical protein
MSVHTFAITAIHANLSPELKQVTRTANTSRFALDHDAAVRTSGILPPDNHETPEKGESQFVELMV